MSERFVSEVSAKIALYKYSSFPFLYRGPQQYYHNMSKLSCNMHSRVHVITLKTIQK